MEMVVRPENLSPIAESGSAPPTTSRARSSRRLLAGLRLPARELNVVIDSENRQSTRRPNTMDNSIANHGLSEDSILCNPTTLTTQSGESFIAHAKPLGSDPKDSAWSFITKTKDEYAENGVTIESDSDVEDFLQRPSKALLRRRDGNTISRRRGLSHRGRPRSRAGTFGKKPSRQHRTLRKSYQQATDSEVTDGLAPAVVVESREHDAAEGVASDDETRKLKLQRQWSNHELMFLQSRRDMIRRKNRREGVDGAYRPIYRGPPGTNTWNAIVGGRLIGSDCLRSRLANQWTVVGVVTALVASWAIDGVFSARGVIDGLSPERSSSARGNDTVSTEKESCVFGLCTQPTTIFKLYGTIMAIAFIFCAMALGLSVILYGYLLVHPVTKTRAYIRNNVRLFPLVIVLMVSGMLLVALAVCIQALVSFGDFAGGLVLFVWTTGLIFFFIALAYVEYNSYREVDDYRLRRANKWIKALS